MFDRAAKGWLAAGFLAWTALVGLGGWLTGYDYRTDLAARDAAQLELRYAEAFAREQAAAAARYENAVERARGADVALTQAREQFAQERQTLQRKIRNVTTVYVPQPGAAPELLPRCVFTRGWLHDYNAALGLPEGRSSSAAGEPGDAPGTAATADAGLLPADGLTQADILAHAGDYGAWCRGLARQADELIRLHEDTP